MYGGPRTHTHIETIKAKDIAVPTWFVIEEYDTHKKCEGDKAGGDKGGGGGRLTSQADKGGGGGARLSRSLTVGSKYAKAKACPRSNGDAHDESSEEVTDDEVYLARHCPYEEQEVRFRFSSPFVIVFCFNPLFIPLIFFYHASFSLSILCDGTRVESAHGGGGGGVSAWWRGALRALLACTRLLSSSCREYSQLSSACRRGGVLVLVCWRCSAGVC